MLTKKRFPFHKQLDNMDCAPSCLKMIINSFGRDVHITELRKLCSVSRLGVNTSELVHAAESCGLDALAFKTTKNYIKQKKPFPCILHWRKNHFVVLYGYINKKYIIADPAHGIIKLSEQDFSDNWIDKHSNKGIAILLQPNHKFENNKINIESDSYIVKKFLSFLSPHKRNLFFLVLAISIATIMSYIVPKTIQYMIDKGVESKNIHIVWKVLLFQLVLFIGIMLSNYIRNIFQINISTSLSIKIISDFLYKLLRLPISFFDSKNYSDIFQRIEDHNRIETFLSTKVISFFFSTAVLIAFCVQLIEFNVILFITFLFFTIVSSIWFFKYHKKSRELDYKRYGLAMEERSTIDDMIRGMTEIKLNNAEDNRVYKWKELQKKIASFKLMKLRLTYAERNGINTLNHICNVIVSFLCAYWVINEKMSFGIMLSVGYIMGQLNMPIVEIMSYFKEYQEAKISLERLNEVQLKSDENNEESLNFPSPFLEGFILNNLSFKYPGSINQNVLNNISLTIPTKKTTAIVGVSGSGKTTLMKLLLSFYMPTEGNIFVDNINYNSLNKDSLRKNCGVVLQNGYIYNASVAENIALQNDIDYDRITEVLKLSCLYDFVKSMPMQEHTIIGDVGLDVSGGQKQRIFIARAIYNNPQVIF